MKSHTFLVEITDSGVTLRRFDRHTHVRIKGGYGSSQITFKHFMDYIF